MASSLLLGSSSPVMCRSPLNGHRPRHKQLIASKGYGSAHHQQPVLRCTASGWRRAVVVLPACCCSYPAVTASSRPRCCPVVNITYSSLEGHHSSSCHGSRLHGSRQRSSSWDSSNSSSSARVGAAAGPGDSAQGQDSDHNADISGDSGILDDAGAGSGRGRVGGSSSGGVSGGGSGGSGSSGSSNGNPGTQPKFPVWYTVWMWCTALVYLVWRWRWRRDRRLAAEQFEREQQAEEQLKQDWQTFAQQYKATGESAATAAVRPLEDHRI